MKEYHKYNVSADCIECKVCSFIAEDNFEIIKKHGAIVKKQPENQQEHDFCEEAKDICPVDAIERIY